MKTDKDKGTAKTGSGLVANDANTPHLAQERCSRLQQIGQLWFSATTLAGLVVGTFVGYFVFDRIGSGLAMGGATGVVIGGLIRSFICMHR